MRMGRRMVQGMGRGRKSDLTNSSGSFGFRVVDTAIATGFNRRLAWKTCLSRFGIAGAG
jgi:hypothetical protein